MIKALLIYSLFLFVFAFVTTVFSLTNIDIEKYFPYVQLMNIGTFVSMGPTIFILRKNTYPKLPTWSNILLLCLGLFSLYFFFVSFFNMTPVSSNGKYFLVNHGNPTIEIGEKEFIKIRTQNFVSYSSRWMIFCGWATIILYYITKSKLNHKTKNL
jgi:hypothetical protein